MENKISSSIHKYQSLDPKSSHISLVAILTPQILTYLFFIYPSTLKSTK